MRHVTVMEIHALSMESLSDQRENIGRLALSVCERERFCLKVMMMMMMDMEMVASQ